MATDVSLGGKQAGAFKTFPEFTKLKAAHRQHFQAAVAHCPATDATSFAPLMTWWNSLDNLAVASLGDNLVISYWLPGMERFSGVSLIGTSKVDEGLCAIFDYQIANGEKPRLVHVPDFVVNNIEHPELFSFTPMHEFDEYIMPVTAMYPLETIAPFKRRRIERFQAHTQNSKVSLRELDLSESSNRVLLLEALTEWPRKGKGNGFSKFSDEMACKMVTGYKELSIKSCGLFVDDILQGFFLYFLNNGEPYGHVMNLRFKNEIPYDFEAGFYMLCERFSMDGIDLLNLGYDVGIARLRALKLSLGPSDFIRKYIIEPAG